MKKYIDKERAKEQLQVEAALCHITTLKDVLDILDQMPIADVTEAAHKQDINPDSRISEYIKREDALEICEKEYRQRLKMQDYIGDTVAWNIGGEIQRLPAADVAPVVHAKWICNDDWWEFICTNCHKAIENTKKYEYCPSCGAKMYLEE